MSMVEAEKRWEKNDGLKNFNTGWWFGTWLLFFHILGIIIPTNYFFRGVETTN